MQSMRLGEGAAAKPAVASLQPTIRGAGAHLPTLLSLRSPAPGMQQVVSVENAGPNLSALQEMSR
jgi:hypothetical protein